MYWITQVTTNWYCHGQQWYFYGQVIRIYSRSQRKICVLVVIHLDATWRHCFKIFACCKSMLKHARDLCYRATETCGFIKIHRWPSWTVFHLCLPLRGDVTYETPYTTGRDLTQPSIENGSWRFRITLETLETIIRAMSVGLWASHEPQVVIW